MPLPGAPLCPPQPQGPSPPPSPRWPGWVAWASTEDSFKDRPTQDRPCHSSSLLHAAHTTRPQGEHRAGWGGAGCALVPGTGARGGGRGSGQLRPGVQLGSWGTRAPVPHLCAGEGAHAHHLQHWVGGPQGAERREAWCLGAAAVSDGVPGTGLSGSEQGSGPWTSGGPGKQRPPLDAAPWS